MTEATVWPELELIGAADTARVVAKVLSPTAGRGTIKALRERRGVDHKDDVGLARRESAVRALAGAVIASLRHRLTGIIEVDGLAQLFDREVVCPGPTTGVERDAVARHMNLARRLRSLAVAARGVARVP